jgi:hypothetical protein
LQPVAFGRDGLLVACRERQNAGEIARELDRELAILGIRPLRLSNTHI